MTIGPIFELQEGFKVQAEMSTEKCLKCFFQKTSVTVCETTKQASSDNADSELYSDP